jgi:hypothetical protein
MKGILVVFRRSKTWLVMSFDGKRACFTVDLFGKSTCRFNITIVREVLGNQLVHERGFIKFCPSW